QGDARAAAGEHDRRRALPCLHVRERRDEPSRRRGRQYVGVGVDDDVARRVGGAHAVLLLALLPEFFALESLAPESLGPESFDEAFDEALAEALPDVVDEVLEEPAFEDSFDDAAFDEPDLPDVVVRRVP